MKYLMVLILYINASYAATCGTETVADINKCKVNDLITQFVDYQSCSWVEDKEKTYKNLVCDPVVALSFYETKLQEWKDYEIERVTEELRIQDITDRLNDLGVTLGKYGTVSGAREFMVECGIDHPNPAIWIKTVYEKTDTNLDCMETKKSKVGSDKAAKNAKKAAKGASRLLLKNYDCETIAEPYLKLLCEERK